MLRKYRLRPFFKDVSLTFITQIVVLVSFFYSYRLIADNFGPKGVGEYSLVKRVVGFLQPVLLLGFGIGLPRYISISKDSVERGKYIRAGGLAVGFVAIVLLGLMNIFNSYFAITFFGNVSYAGLVLPVSLFVASITLHTAVSSCLRGRLFARAFNFLDILNLALVPVIILLFIKNLTIGKLIAYIGVSTFIISLFFSVSFVREALIPGGMGELSKSLRELLIYSFPRFLNGFVYAAFFSLGPICAAHFVSIQEVGYLSVSQSLLGTVGSMVAPLGIILLPKIGSLISQQREAEITENLSYLIGATVCCSIFVLFQMLIFTSAIIKYWLGPDFIASAPIMRIILCSIPFFLFCGTAGNILEASKVKPINLINLSISLGASLLIAGVLLFFLKSVPPGVGISIAFTSGLVCFGVLSYISIRKIYPDELNKDWDSLWKAVAVNAFLGMVAALIAPLVSANLYYLLVAEMILGVMFLAVLWLIKAEWIRRIPEKVLAG